MLILMQIIFIQMAFSLLSSAIIWSRDLDNNRDRDFNELDHYTVTELNKIESLRVNMKDVLLKEYERSDDFLIRWLQDANMDLKTASQNLRNAMNCRQDNQMDAILNKTFTTKNNKLKLTQPCHVEGVDKTGGPIIIYKLKGFDLRNNIASGYYEKSLSQLIQCVEHYVHKSISGGPKSEQIRVTAGIAIWDLQGFSLKQHGCLKCVDLYREVTLNVNKMYPRNSKFMVFINASPFARKVVEMVKPFLPPFFFSCAIYQKINCLQNMVGQNKYCQRGSI